VPFNRAFHGDGKLSYLLSLLGKGIDDDDNDDDDESIEGPSSQIQLNDCIVDDDVQAPVFGENLSNEQLMAMFSDETEANGGDNGGAVDVNGGDFAGDDVEVNGGNNVGEIERFMNGFGYTLASEAGRLLKSRVETKQSKADFLDSDMKWLDCMTVDFKVIPFLWHKRRVGRVHHVADIVMIVTIVAHQLGFKSPDEYVQCRGWTFSNKDGIPIIEYRKLEQVIDKMAPNNQAAVLARNFKAMIDHLYDLISSEGIKNVFTGKSAVAFLEKPSFIAKIHKHTQDFQLAIIVTKSFFLDHVSSHHGNTMYWMKKLFCHCRLRKDFAMFCSDVFTLFEDGGDPALAKELLTEYLDCIRDEVSRRASSSQHKQRYTERLEEMIGSTLIRGSRTGSMPSDDRSLLFARARIRDMVFMYLSKAEKEAFKSSTRKTRKGQKIKGKRNVSVGKCC